MSANASICVNEGMYWNSIWTTSGTPSPALSAVRSLVYWSAPCPALTYLTSMSGCDFSKSWTSFCIPGTHDQKVISTGPDEDPQEVVPNTTSTVVKSAATSPRDLVFFGTPLREGGAPIPRRAYLSCAKSRPDDNSLSLPLSPGTPVSPVWR